jgi:hypothetical protein
MFKRFLNLARIYLTIFVFLEKNQFLNFKQLKPSITCQFTLAASRL